MHKSDKATKDVSRSENETMANIDPYDQQIFDKLDRESEVEKGATINKSKRV